MKQYGDITKLSGYELDPVDLIVGGSPCQDLSVAGKRAGLDGERSGLFMEMIRIIKEMRSKTNGIYPRFILWENVPGALSSGKPKGADFSAVLGEFARIAEPDAPDVPIPEEGWSKSGVLLGSDWSLAWRITDAQFWGKTIRDSRTGNVLALGTPQRRRRIALVADLRGQSAPEILFERKSLSGNSEQGSQTGQGSAGTSENSTRSASELIMIEMTSTKNTICQGGTSPTLTARMGTGGNQVNAVYDPSVHHGYRQFNEVSETVRSRYGTGGNNQPLVVATMQGFGDYVESDTASSCKQRDYKDATDLVCRMDAICFSPSSFGTYAEGTGSLRAAGGDQGYGSENLVCHTQNDVAAVDCRNASENETCNGTLQAKANGGWNANSQNCVRQGQCVRRLTPLECERLQGYPDGWTNIPGASDSAKFKALGNSICLPMWEWLAHRFAEMVDVKTIGSLFDGIGGFPLVFKRAGAETLWTSEIEPFCQKVVEWHVANGDL